MRRVPTPDTSAVYSGISKETVAAWSSDPQVEFEGKKQSLFDLLEDLDARDCLDKAKKIAGL